MKATRLPYIKRALLACVIVAATILPSPTLRFSLASNVAYAVDETSEMAPGTHAEDENMPILSEGQDRPPVSSSAGNRATNDDTYEIKEETQLPFVLVTGANGFIGSSLVQELLRRGHRVRGSVRDTTNTTKTGALRSLPHADTLLELVPFDLKTQHPQVYRQLLSGEIEWVFHSAAIVKFKPKYDDEEHQLEQAAQALKLLLTAAQDTPSVSQVVYTGSASAISQGHLNDPIRSKEDYVMDEDDWTNVDGPFVTSYHKIKTATERIAWEFVDAINPSFRFTSVNPSIVLGPMATNTVMSSMRIIQRILSGSDPGLINVFMSVVDIRDVVEAHINAAVLPSKTTIHRRRYLVTKTDTFLPEFASILRDEFGPMGYRIPTLIIPKWIVWCLTWFDSELAMIYGRIDYGLRYSNERSKDDLELNYHNISKTLLDAGHSMIYHDLIPKTEGYRAPTSDEF